MFLASSSPHLRSPDAPLFHPLPDYCLHPPQALSRSEIPLELSKSLRASKVGVYPNR
jgi:hypothetical protein